MTKIVLVSTQVAPFQLELAHAANAMPGIEYRAVFTQSENKRPAYWLDLDEHIENFSVIAPSEVVSPEQREAWTVAELRKLAPDVLLVGGVRGPHVSAAFAFRRAHAPDIPVGMWMEPPLRNEKLTHTALRRLDYLGRLRKADFVLAIGDRAHAYYRGCNANTHFVPYGSDLSHCLELALPKPRADKVRFLFSGGLHARHNFPLIMEAFSKLLERRGPVFEFVISGDGPEKAVIDASIASNPALGRLVHYDRDFTGWMERLRPFREAHVFIYPTAHAGWGIVIPEAMAAGNPVIASANAEAARYLVTDGVDGLIVKPELDAFLQALERCVDDRDWVERAGIAARTSAIRCHAPHVAGQLVSTIRIATGGRV